MPVAQARPPVAKQPQQPQLPQATVSLQPSTVMQPVYMRQPAVKKEVAFEKMTLKEKLEVMATRIETTRKRLTYCMWFMGVCGAFILFSAVSSFHKSREWAKLIAETGKMPWGKDPKEIEALLQQHHADAPTEAEIDLYELLVKTAAMTFLIALSLFTFARLARFSRHAKKTCWLKGMFYRGVASFLFFMFAYISVKTYCVEIKAHIKDLPTESEGHEQHHRGLREHHGHWERMPMHMQEGVTLNLQNLKPEDIFNQMQNEMDQAWNTQMTMHNMDMPQPMPVAAEEPKEEGIPREDSYRMFAHKLWPYAQEHEPKQAQNHEEAPKEHKKWPKAHGTCPVMLAFMIAMIGQLVLIKVLEKALTQQQLYKKAQEVLAKQAPADVEAESQASFAVVAPLPSLAPMPAAPQTPVTLLDKEGSDDFSYSIEEPLIESTAVNCSINSASGYDVQINSSNGNISIKNSMV